MPSGSRIKELRKFRKLSQQAFAESLKVSRSYLGDIEVERCEPSFNFLQALYNVYNVNLNWIMAGDGEMYQSPKLEVETVTPPENEKWCAIFEQLSAEQQQMILFMAQELMRSNCMDEKLQQLSNGTDKPKYGNH
jgi:transcriptional regulator with XRE-family HTH domain